MTSLQSLSDLQLGPLGSHGKPTKARGKVVKPILKKLSHSEKNSLDLDRGWEDQDEQYQNPAWASHGSPLYQFHGAGRSAKDVSFSGVDAATAPGRRYNHSRSISGTSHVSVATSGSGGGPRSGTTFVHPFQQVPRTATPPLSYANSLASVADARDYSPTITEDGDDIDPTQSHPSSVYNYGGTSSSSGQPANPYSASQPSLGHRRPSLASQRTSSFSDNPNSQQPALRVSTSRTMPNTPAQSSRLMHVSSRSDLNLSLSPESPGSSVIPASVFGSPPSGSVSHMSPIRSSFEAASLARLRAKSDLDTATRAEHVREARRKFEAREQAKEEKYAREEIKKRERADNKRAQELEKQAALRKESGASPTAVATASAATSRKDSTEMQETTQGRAGKQLRKTSMAGSGRRPSTSRNMEKFVSSNYDTVETLSPPAFGNEAGSAAHEVTFQSTKKRTKTAKKKTHGAWTSFLIWFRTNLLRMGRKD